MQNVQYFLQRKVHSNISCQTNQIMRDFLFEKKYGCTLSKEDKLNQHELTYIIWISYLGFGEVFSLELSLVSKETMIPPVE